MLKLLDQDQALKSLVKNNYHQFCVLWTVCKLGVPNLEKGLTSIVQCVLDKNQELTDCLTTTKVDEICKSVSENEEKQGPLNRVQILKCLILISDLIREKDMPTHSRTDVFSLITNKCTFTFLDTHYQVTEARNQLIFDNRYLLRLLTLNYHVIIAIYEELKENY